MEKKKLLILTDTPLVKTGLGRIGRELSKQIKDDFEIAFAGWHHLPLKHEHDFHIYPLRKGHPEEVGQLQMILQDFIPDYLLCIGDLWDFSLTKNAIANFKDQRQPKLKTLLWATVDGEYLGNELSDTIRSFDSIISFSHYGVKELEKVSKGAKYNVVYPGVDRDIFFSFPKEHKWGPDNVIDVDNTFTVLSVGQNSDRKNMPATIEAFAEFAKDKKDVLLFLVTDPRDQCGFDLWSIINRCNIGERCVVAKDSGATGSVDDQKLNLLYNMSTVLLNTAIGEGYGLPLAEAQACECVPMVTNYAAGAEIVGDRGVILDAACIMYGMFGIKRAWVSHESIVKSLNTLYTDWVGDKKLINEYNDKGKVFVAEHSWEKTAREFKDIINSIEDDKPRSWVKEKIKVKEMKLLQVVPSWGKNCGIAEYSKELFEAIEAEDTDEVNVFPSNDLISLVDTVKAKEYNTVVFQHEYSFFQDRLAFAKALDDLRELNVKSIVEFHTFSPIKNYNNMVIARADEVIVHCDLFKDNMLNGNTSDNLSVIKLMCKDKFIYDNQKIKEKLGIAGGTPIIGSFGFMRDQKGYKDIAEAIKLLIPQYPDIKFLLVAPEHEFGSSTYEENFYKYIEDIGMSDRILIIREYMDEEKLLQVLSCADMFVLNYKTSRLGGGNSAAIKTLMRVQKPIIVSDTIYFSDLEGDEVHKVKDLDKISIKETIEKVYQDKELINSLVEKSNKFLVDNSPTNSAGKHLNVYAE